MDQYKAPIKTLGAILSFLFIMATVIPLCPSAGPTAAFAGSSADQKIYTNIQFPSFADLAEQLKPSVVNIFTTKVVKTKPFQRFYQPFEEKEGPFDEFFDRYKKFFQDAPEQEFRQRSLGSGFIIDPEGFILTNNHVIENADEIKVRLDNNEKEYEAVIVGRDPATDLALIKVKTNTKLPTASLGDSDALRVGEWVIAIGNPFGYGHTVTAGIVSAMGRIIGAGPYDDFIQTDASINPGNSGGPLFNVRGEVVGINTAIVASGQGIGFATPINKARELLPQLKEGKVTRGWLGVGIQEVSNDLAQNFGLKENMGALISEVFPGEPAEKAGLKRGDIILEVGGKKIENVKALLNIAASLSVGERIEVKVWRDGKAMNMNLIVGKRPDETKLAKRSWQQPQKEEEDESLGITVAEITSDLARRLEMSSKEGVIVKNVKSNSPADKAGLLEGDIILEINRIAIKDFKGYKMAIEKFSKTDSLLILIKRGTNSQYIVLKK